MWARGLPNAPIAAAFVVLSREKRFKDQGKERTRAEVTILYRDIRTFGLMERFYTEARKQGISFIPYDLDSKPDLRVEDHLLHLKVKDKILGEEVDSQTGPRCSGKRHCPLRKWSVGEDAQSPFEFERFLPRGSHEVEARRFRNRWHLPGWIVALSEGHQRMHCSGGRGCGPGTAAIARGYVTVLPTISEVDPERCIGCGLCEILCPFSAIRVVETEKGKKSETITASCKGCGVCSASCPQTAITIHHFSDEQLTAQIDALMAEKNEAA